MSHRADITIIGAGVVGLAVGSQVAGKDREVYLLKKTKHLDRSKALATVRSFMPAFTMKQIL